MKFHRLYLIPLIFVLSAVIASIVSFMQNDRLEQGYVHSSNPQESAIYGGTYFSVLGNIKTASHLSISSDADGIKLRFYDENALLVESYVYQIYPVGESYDSSIVSVTPLTMVEIDELEDYLFTVELEEGTTYEIHLEMLEGPSEDPVDIILITLDGDAYLLKQAMESIVYIGAILGVISLIIVAVIHKVR